MSGKARKNPGSSNLIPNSQRSPEELREMGRKGGIASGKARRKKKQQQEMAGLIMDVLDDIGKKDPEKLIRLIERILRDVGGNRK